MRGRCPCGSSILLFFLSLPVRIKKKVKMCTLTAWFNNNPDTPLEQAKLVFGAWCADEGVKIIKEQGRKCPWKPSGYGYDRALVYQNAPHFDVIAIRWNPYAKAPRHDHAPPRVHSGCNVWTPERTPLHLVRFERTFVCCRT